MITVDTSALLSLLDERDRHHAACVAVIDADSGPYLISTATLSEIAWLLETRFRPQVEALFLEDVRSGAYVLDWDRQDIDRIQVLTARYADMPLGLSDAAVIACAERNGGRVLTTDFRHFPVVAREGSLTVLPDPS